MLFISQNDKLEVDFPNKNRQKQKRDKNKLQRKISKKRLRFLS